ncbi:MAG: hypothetical protein II839_12175 [Kiritimatiellae bacterium]|nr:hypothetical protein [Kiritimatiellia bacterium]
MPYGTSQRNHRSPGRRFSGHGQQARRYRYAPAFASPRYSVERFSYGPNARKANRNLAMTVAPFAVLWYAAPLFMAGLLGFGFLCGLLGPVVQRALAARRRGVAAAERAQKAMRVVHRASRREPPSRELLLRCWELSRTSLEGKILLGSLLGDVDAVEDHSYIRGDGGEIVGRRGGVRRWLDATCPGLVKHYKTLMRYKAMADKFRRTCGLGDPDSAEDALAAGETCAGEIADFRFQISDFKSRISDVDTRKFDTRFVPTPAATLAAARNRARELLATHRTAKALDDALWAALGLVRTRRRPVAA